MLRGFWLRLVSRRPRALSLTRQLASALVIGVVTGLGALVFYLMLHGAAAVFLGAICGYVPAGAAGEPSLFADWTAQFAGQPNRALLLIMPALGGLVSGLVVYTFAPEAEGPGTDAAVLAFHRLGGRVRGRVPLVKAIASAVTIGSGGSGGREGPISQIGAGFGSYLATRLGLSDRERRLLVLAGMAGGVGAIFKAPLAGALFAGEVLYREEELEYEALVPATVASIVAYSIFCSVVGWDPIFVTSDVAFQRPLDLVGYSLLGVVCSVGAWLYVSSFSSARAFFGRLRLPLPLKPMLGGLATGVCGWFMPELLATSYGQIQRALDGDPTLSIGFLLLLAGGKIVATSCSIGSGGSGGVFGPAMVIGGALGAACGLVCEPLGLVEQPAAMVLVGMAGFFAGAAKCPISTVIMVSEMTGNYRLLVPCMLTCTISMLLLRRQQLYKNQVPGRHHSPAHAGELAVDVLQALRIGDWMNARFESLRDDTPLLDLLPVMADAPHTRLPVLDADGDLRGILDVRDVLSMIRSPQAQTLRAADLADPHYTTITSSATLHDALVLLDREPHGMLIVTAEPGQHAPVGLLRRQDVLHAYHAAGATMLRSVHRDEAGAVHLPADVTVGEAMTADYATVPPDLPLSELEALFHQTGHHGFPVVSSDSALLGLVTLSDLERHQRREGLTVIDITTRRLVTCWPYETLVEALRKFGRKQVGRLPVVDPADPHRLVGMLRRSDVINAIAAAAAHEQHDDDAAVIHSLDVPQARFIEYTIRPTSPAAQRQVKDLALPANSLLVSIRRGEALLVPHGETWIEVGDRVTVLTSTTARPQVQEVLAAAPR